LQLGAFTFVNADEIARSMRQRGEFAQVDFRAGREMLDRIRQCISLRENLMIETTLASANWARHIPDWQELGYRVVLYYLRLSDADTAVRRVASRVAAGGHDIPEPVIRRRFARSLRNLDAVYKATVDQWYVFDSFEDEPPKLAETWSRS